MVKAMEIQIFKYENVSHKSSKQMVCCYRQLFEFTKRSQYYKNNNGGIAIGRPYNPGPRMRFLGFKFRQKKITFVHIKLVSNFLKIPGYK